MGENNLERARTTVSTSVCLSHRCPVQRRCSNTVPVPSAAPVPHAHRHAAGKFPAHQPGQSGYEGTGASSGSTASSRADGQDACSRPHDHRHAKDIPAHQPGQSGYEGHKPGQDGTAVSLRLPAATTADHDEPQWFECGDSHGQPEWHAAVEVAADPNVAASLGNLCEIRTEADLDEEPMLCGNLPATLECGSVAFLEGAAAAEVDNDTWLGSICESTSEDGLVDGDSLGGWFVALDTTFATPPNVQRVSEPSRLEYGGRDDAFVYLEFDDEEQARDFVEELPWPYKEFEGGSVAAAAEKEEAAGEEPAPTGPSAATVSGQRLNTPVELDATPAEPDGPHGAYATKLDTPTNGGRRQLEQLAIRVSSTARLDVALDSTECADLPISALGGTVNFGARTPAVQGASTVPTTRREIGVSRRPEFSEFNTFVVDTVVAAFLTERGAATTSTDALPLPASGECALSVAAAAEEEAGEERVLTERGNLAATLEDTDMRAWLDNLCETRMEADFDKVAALAAAVATGGEPIEPEQHAATGDPEQRALGELNRLDGNASTTAVEGGGQDESVRHASANEPEQRAHGEPGGLDGNTFATAGMGAQPLAHGAVIAMSDAFRPAGIAPGSSDAPPETGVDALPTTRRKLGVPLPAGDTSTKLASAQKPLAPIGPRAVTITGRLASARTPAGADAARELGALLPAGDKSAKPTLAPAGLTSAPRPPTPIGPSAATGSSRLAASLAPAAWATSSAPTRSRSSSFASPASSMSPGGEYEIASCKIVFAGDMQEAGFASNCDDSPGRGGADGTGAEESNYVSNKANQDQTPGRFSLATLVATHTEASGAGFSVSSLVPSAADALSAGAIRLESTGRPPGHAAADAFSAGATKLESTGRPPDHAAADALSAAATTLESKRSPLGHAAADALSAGATKLESKRSPLGHTADALSAGATKLESTRSLLGHTADALSAGANTLESTRRTLGGAVVDALSAGVNAL